MRYGKLELVVRILGLGTALVAVLGLVQRKAEENIVENIVVRALDDLLALDG